MAENFAMGQQETFHARAWLLGLEIVS
jgi:hypothetical protein